jgi:hypothetical protein
VDENLKRNVAVKEFSKTKLRKEKARKAGAFLGVRGRGRGRGALVASRGMYSLSSSDRLPIITRAKRELLWGVITAPVGSFEFIKFIAAFPSLSLKISYL